MASEGAECKSAGTEQNAEHKLHLSSAPSW